MGRNLSYRRGEGAAPPLFSAPMAAGPFGRGRGGRGRGRGRGAQPPSFARLRRPSSSTSWVRPKETAAVPRAGSEVEKDGTETVPSSVAIAATFRERGGDDEGFSANRESAAAAAAAAQQSAPSANAIEPTAEVAATPSTNGPVLRGGPPSVVASVAARRKRTWTRLRDEKADQDCGGTRGSKEGHGPTTDPPSSATVESPTASSAAEQMERRGQHSLVLSRRVGGPNIVEAGENDAKDEGAKEGNGNETRGSGGIFPTDVHIGRGRGRGRGGHLPGSSGGRGRGVRRGRGSSLAPDVKRIRLNAPTNDSADGDGENDEGASEEASTAAGPLTDFAYRKTSTDHGRRRGRGRGRGRGLTSSTGRSMGLVRVGASADPSTSSSSSTAAPFRACPTFLRGTPCDDPSCALRHDVPPDAAKPHCAFFQRNGQCLRMYDGCPFRHVKVNPRAAVCPAFRSAGYCLDAGCVLRHVVVSNVAAGSGRSGGRSSLPSARDKGRGPRGAGRGGIF